VYIRKYECMLMNIFACVQARVELKLYNTMLYNKTIIETIIEKTDQPFQRIDKHLFLVGML